jgi:3-hydroxy-D-aspartate aldolase
MGPVPWFALDDAASIPTPALLVYLDRVDQNLARMVEVAGSVDRMRPHVKTHKAPQVVQRQLAQGIDRFKCATIAEAEMTAGAGAGDVLLAYQPVGPNIARLATLTRRFPSTRFSALVDDEATARAIAAHFASMSGSVDLLIDLDVGMHRSGIPPDGSADRLYRLVTELPGVGAGGLHVYDGHIREPELAARRRQCDAAYAPVEAMSGRLRAAGLEVPRIVAGGTPTFPIHAARAGVECSPGTCVYWDAGYGGTLQDLDFVPAALVMTRVVSKPGGTRVCLDLGHKAIASENPHPRVILFGHAAESPLAARFVGHSEEHLVLETPDAEALSVGDCLFGIPWHICPTVALHAETLVVVGRRVVDRWVIQARARRISI